MTKPCHEAIAAEHLRRQGYQFYYPRFLERKPNRTPRVRPLFPRYMFVFIEQAWYSLLGTRGISCVLMGVTGPAVLTSPIIDALKQREDSRGLVSLTIPPKFKPGEAVKARSGPLAGHLLIVDGMPARERCRVLLNLLGRQVPCDLAESLLVAA